MIRKRWPNGRENLIAGSALESIKESESREREAAGLSALFPVKAARPDNSRGAIRLINLERRARFSRLSLETN